MKNYLFPAILAFIGLNLLASFSSTASTLFGLALLAWAAWLLVSAIKGKGSAKGGNALQDQLAAFNYHHCFGDSGIAVDATKQEVHLASKGAYKVYPFSQIRSWETNLATGGMVTYAPNFTSGIAATAANLRQQQENKANTGLFIQVRDVDHPKWHIQFPPKDVQRQLERWMEILRQEVNESS